MHDENVQLRVSLTGRYATALFKEAIEKKAIEEVVKEASSFTTLLQNHPELAQTLKNPSIPSRDIIAIIADISKLLKFSPLFSGFLKVIAQNQRCPKMGQIFRDFFALVDAKNTVLPVIIEKAPMSKKNSQAIEEHIKALYPHQTCRFEHHETPELLGGFRAFIKHRCLDYSLKSRLNRLSYHLKEA